MHEGGNPPDPINDPEPEMNLTLSIGSVPLWQSRVQHEGKHDAKGNGYGNLDTALHNHRTSDGDFRHVVCVAGDQPEPQFSARECGRVHGLPAQPFQQLPHHIVNEMMVSGMRGHLAGMEPATRSFWPLPTISCLFFKRTYFCRLPV
jgi:hypothetical protein